MATTKKDLIALLEKAGDNTLSGQEKLDQLLAQLKDARANGVQHLLTEEDLKANPELLTPKDGEKAAEVGDLVVQPFPAELVEESEALLKEDVPKPPTPPTPPAPPEANKPKKAEAFPEAEVGDEEDVEVELAKNVKYGVEYPLAGSKIVVKGKEAREMRVAGVLK